MYKKITSILILLVSIFLFKINVYAECSYKERKELLNEAKQVDIAYEIETKQEKITDIKTDFESGSTVILESYNFKFSVINLSSNLFIRYYNLFDNYEEYLDTEDFKDGIYSFNDSNYSDIYKYYFEFYSKNSNCSGELVYTKKIIKPKFNTFTKYPICSEKGMENYKYCKKFITKDFNITDSEFSEKAYMYKKSLTTNSTPPEKKENKFLTYIKKYYYIPLIIILIIIVLIFIKIIKKKRSEL